MARVDDRLALLRPEQGQMVSGGGRGGSRRGRSSSPYSRIVPAVFPSRISPLLQGMRLEEEEKEEEEAEVRTWARLGGAREVRLG